MIISRVGPDLVFLAGCRMSGACQIRPEMPDYPAGYFILPDYTAEYPAYPAGSGRHRTSGIRQELPDPAQP